MKVPETTEELEKVLIAFRDHAEELKSEFDIEGDVIPMSFIINNGDQDPAILINGFGEGYGDTGDHFAVTDEGKVIYTTVQEGYKEGIQWLHELVEQKLLIRKLLHRNGLLMWRKEKATGMVCVLHGISRILIIMRIM